MGNVICKLESYVVANGTAQWLSSPGATIRLQLIERKGATNRFLLWASFINNKEHELNSY